MQCFALGGGKVCLIKWPHLATALQPLQQWTQTLPVSSHRSSQSVLNFTGTGSIVQLLKWLTGRNARTVDVGLARRCLPVSAPCFCFIDDKIATAAGEEKERSLLLPFQRITMPNYLQ